MPVEQAGRTIQLAAQLYRPASPQPAPAVAIFHGCGGVGVNNTRMAELLKAWGYVALVVDSFSARGLKDVCGRNWPTQAAAEERAHDIDAALAWLGKQSFVDARRLAFMGYSYGGGVAMLRALSPASDTAAPTPARAAILIYPDCALADALGSKLAVAHHSFDALGLPVRYLDGVGNRSKPGGCCGAHYGANEAAWQAFVIDVKAFLAKSLGP